VQHTQKSDWIVAVKKILRSQSAATKRVRAFSKIPILFWDRQDSVLKDKFQCPPKSYDGSSKNLKDLKDISKNMWAYCRFLGGGASL